MPEKRLVDEIADAQTILNAEIHDALCKFTETTGLCVQGVKFTLHIDYDGNGRTQAVYYDTITSNISTGIL